MNILTFDIEEWYYEKVFRGGRIFRYQQFDEAFAKVMYELDKLDIKATFFCVGQLAVEFPEVVKTIVAKGHEIGCHSNNHTWLDKMDEKTLYRDTTEALKALEDVSGQKVTCYRAPAFSITPKNKWAVNVLSDCGIESDASICPTNRDFGGYKDFPQDTPCVISHEGASLKEYPICLTNIIGKQMAYSGGGYFRLMPLWLVNRIMTRREYNIFYFHLADLLNDKVKLMSKAEYEKYFKEPGTFKKRLKRYVMKNLGRGDNYGKLCLLLENHLFISIAEAGKQIDWIKANTIRL